MADQCRQLKELGFYHKDDKDKGKEDSKKDGEDQADKGFQHPKGVISVIFVGVSTAKNKRQYKLALRDIMASEPATPTYLNWFEYPIHFSRQD